MNYQSQPVIIGATGGSGTRVVARIVRHSGFFMGTNLNNAEDALEFLAFHDRWINVYLSEKEMPLTVVQKELMVEEFHVCIRKHRAFIPDESQKWGWKAPRSIYFLPFFHAQYPQMKFIHVVRDGRDMAYSKNQIQLKKHGKEILSEEQKKLNTSLRSIALWSLVNITAANYGETEMKENYFRVRFEDLCTRLVETIEQIYDFLGTPAVDLSAAIAEVTPPGSIGRWKKQNTEELSEILKLGRQALERFSYWSGERDLVSESLKAR